MATLEVAPANPLVGMNLVFSGSGYAPGVGVTVTVQSPYALSFFGAISDADGNFSTEATETFTAQVAGEYTANAYQSPKKRKALATKTFSVG